MKYELFKDSFKDVKGVRLYKIKALKDFGQIQQGALGGWVEKEDNLSQEGNCWVFGDARVFGDTEVFGNARVFGDAEVFGNARVSGNARVFGDTEVFGDALVFGNAEVFGNARVLGNARVFGDALVFGNAEVSGNAQVAGNAKVSGNAEVSGNAQILVVGPALSSGRYTTAFTDTKIGVRVTSGCFSGSVKEFNEAIEETHKDNKEALKQYRLFCRLIADNFDVKLKD